MNNFPLYFSQVRFQLSWILSCVTKKPALNVFKAFTQVAKTYIESFSSWKQFSWNPWICAWNHDYLRFCQCLRSVINDSKNVSGGGKRFFRTFANFLVPGLSCSKMRISKVTSVFSNLLVKLAIFQKSTIFQCPLKSVDEGWHRRYKKFETFNHSIIEPQKIVGKFDDKRLMLKNTWGGGKRRPFSPPQRSEYPILRRYVRHDTEFVK